MGRGEEEEVDGDIGEEEVRTRREILGVELVMRRKWEILDLSEWKDLFHCTMDC